MSNLIKAKDEFHKELNKIKYAYNFNWLGLKILQIPQDIQAMQEIIWEVKPEIIIETGVAHGGSLIFSASMLTLLEACGQIEKGRVIGVEYNLYEENRKAIFEHPLGKKIYILNGSSVDYDIIKQIRSFVKRRSRVLVFLDSNHTHEHVLEELKEYSKFVSVGSYIIVNDTGIEDLPEEMSKDRAWGKGNNPKTAIWEFMKTNDEFEIDFEIESKILITGQPSGYLRRVKLSH